MSLMVNLKWGAWDFAYFQNVIVWKLLELKEVVG